MFGQKNNDADSHDNQTASTETVIAGSDTSWQHPGQPLSSSGTDQTSDIGNSTTDSIVPEPASAPVASSPVIASPTDSAPSASPFSTISSSKPDDDKDDIKDEPAKDNKDDLLDNSQTDLLEIKQKALNELSPLMTHLDQTPEEKFRTLMMMLQASDDQKLVKEVYEAAQGIKDDKVRAQALLDIVNEINYFTQQSGN